MRQILKYIINIIALFIFVQPTFGQIEKWIPSQIKVGGDLSYLGVNLISKEKNQFELTADIDVNRFFITGDYGFAEWKFTDEDYAYNNSGIYFRAGIDYNFIKIDEDNNTIYIGFRYASSQFNENFEYAIIDPIYGNYTENIQVTGRNGRWFEGVVGMKIQVWKGLFLGWTARFKFAKKISSPPATFNNFWIPGYGKSSRESVWGLNYQIFYRIPLRKKKIIIPPEVEEIEN